MSAAEKFLEVKTRGDTLIFQLGDGQRVEFNPEEASPAIRKAAMLHGFNQKIRDAAAGYSKVNDFDGAMEAMQGVVDALLLEDSWNRKAKGTGLNRGDLAYAIAKIKGVSIERATAAVEDATEEQRKTWGKNAKVAALMAESRQKRLQAAADAAEAPEDLPDIA